MSKFGTMQQPEPQLNGHRSAHSSYQQKIKGTKAEVLSPDLWARNLKGIETYGVPLQPHNGRNQLIDAYQELLDAVQYLEAALMERFCPQIYSYQKTVEAVAVQILETLEEANATKEKS